ncbi:TPA: fructose-bisphosphate aldolase [Candidatus Micrarchaeota archaeon]|nr:fructose-bisphosphate aldolase [Candidatus Micrarchaeota archaeon]HIH31000.1 fructose-bisphosphate aldolase [Candidatus Micrarchaeota archaeon]
MKAKESHFDKIVRNGHVLILAMDQGMEHGPRDFNQKNINPEYVCDIASRGGFTGFALQKGVARHYKENYSGKVPLVLKLNGRTEIVPKDEAYSPQLATVKEAVDLGADAVGYTIYVGSPMEYQMFKEFGAIEREAHDYGLACVVWSYPRGKYVKDEKSPEMVAYAARVALEIGADVVKINYPGSIDAMKWVAASAGRCKVISAGGSKQPDAEFLQKVKDIMAGGGSGLAVGRNVWQNDNPMRITEEIKKIIFG